MLASVASVIVERSILGNEPLGRVPAYHLVHPAELSGAHTAVLEFSRGIVRLCSVADCCGSGESSPSSHVEQMASARDRRCGDRRGARVRPQVMGVGYEYVDQALNGGLVWKTMLLLCGQARRHYRLVRI